MTFSPLPQTLQAALSEVKADREEIKRLRAERDAAIREVGKYARQAGLLAAERDALRDLLREARSNWIQPGYGATKEDMEQYKDFCARLTAAIDAARGGPK